MTYSGSKKPHIGIITALPKEQAAMLNIIEGPQQLTVENDSSIYTIGTIKGFNCVHTVVLSCLSKYANNMAAAATTNMLRSFPSITDVIFVGIAGGVPRPENKDAHVRLGDVVVSSGQGIVQFDLGAYKPSGFEIRDSSPKPSAKLLQAVNYLESEKLTRRVNWSDYLNEHFAAHSIVVPKSEPPKPFKHPRGSRKYNIHIGKIGASNSLIKDEKKRNEIAGNTGIIAFEMEGSGLADATWDAATGYLVIRGICDYGDINKNDDWQEIAAHIASAYCSLLLRYLPNPQSYISSSTAIFEPHTESKKATSVVHVSRNRLTSCKLVNTTIYCAGFEGVIFKINLQSMTVTKYKKLSDEIIRCIDYLDYLQLIVVGDDYGGLFLVDPEDLDVVCQTHVESSVLCLHIYKNNTFITGERNGNITEWQISKNVDTLSVTPLRRIAKCESSVFSVNYANKKQTFIFLCSNGQLYRFDGLSGNLDSVQISNEALFSGDISDDNLMGVIGCADGIIYLYEKGEQLFNMYNPKLLVGHKSTVRKIRLTKMSRWIISASKDGTARLWSSISGEVKIFYENNEYIYDFEINEEQKSIYLVDAAGNLIAFNFNSNLDLCNE